MPKTPLNYTTRIAASQTVGECHALLAEAGADAVATMYDHRVPNGLSFRLDTPHGPADFVMPVNIDGVAACLAKATYPASVRPSMIRMYATREHAVRVGWRVLRDWLEAQLSIIDAQMATIDEIMLPFLQIAPGRTLAAEYAESAGMRAAIERGPR